MRRCILLLALLLLAGATFGATTSHASPRWLKDRYSGLYHAVKKDNPGAQGRNIRRYGVRVVHFHGKRKHVHVRRATTNDYLTSIRRFRAWRHAGASNLVPTSPRPAPANIATPGPNGTLTRIAACESGGNPGAISSNGLYRGKYQFDRETWAGVGGSGDPAAASEAEQDKRAAILLALRGTQPWPTCGA